LLATKTQSADVTVADVVFATSTHRRGLTGRDLLPCHFFVNLQFSSSTTDPSQHHKLYKCGLHENLDWDRATEMQTSAETVTFNAIVKSVSE